MTAVSTSKVCVEAIRKSDPSHVARAYLDLDAQPAVLAGNLNNALIAARTSPHLKGTLTRLPSIVRYLCRDLGLDRPANWKPDTRLSKLRECHFYYRCWVDFSQGFAAQTFQTRAYEKTNDGFVLILGPNEEQGQTPQVFVPCAKCGRPECFLHPEPGASLPPPTVTATEAPEGQGVAAAPPSEDASTPVVVDQPSVPETSAENVPLAHATQAPEQADDAEEEANDDDKTRRGSSGGG